MKTIIILMVSGALIGAGLTIIVRDIQRSRRRAFVTERDAPAGVVPDVEVTISGTEDKAEQKARASSSSTAAASAAPPSVIESAPRPPALRPGLARGQAAIAERKERHTPPPSLEQQWIDLQPAIEAAVQRVEPALAAARLALTVAGDPAWSYKNRGYGGYHRVMQGGESVAWLRLEVAADDQMHVSVKAHKDDRAAINATAAAPLAGLDTARIGDLLMQALQPALAQLSPQHLTADSDEAASERAWMTVDAVVAGALRAANGALAQAGARLVPLGPAAWEGVLRRHRLALRVEVHGADVARMHVERLPQEMEVAVGVRDAHLADLSRRRRLPVDGMTIHALAEVIAGCAWPAIARFRDAAHRTL